MGLRLLFNSAVNRGSKVCGTIHYKKKLQGGQACGTSGKPKSDPMRDFKYN